MSGDLVRPIMEFLPLFAEESARGASTVLFHPTKMDGETHHVYLQGVMDALKACRGVYVFYDSRGSALYAGKAEEQSLWTEMNLAYNRDRGPSQELWRVAHPMKRPPVYVAKVRPIRRTQVSLHELACYASAYEVRQDDISAIEALLLRAFANDLLNTRMETIR